MPISIISGNSLIKHKSFDENILVPFSSISTGIRFPGLLFSSAYKLKLHLQLCAQSPKLALLPAKKSLKKFYDNLDGYIREIEKVKTRGLTTFYFNDRNNKDIQEYEGKQYNNEYEFGGKTVLTGTC